MATPPSEGPKSLRLSLLNIYETFLICWPTVLEAFAGRVSKEVCDDRLFGWAAEVKRNAGYDVEIHGGEHLAPHEAFLVMSNHQSLYDIPVLFTILGSNLRMITKTELFRVPVFGPAMKASGFIEIDRSNRQRALESLSAAKKKMEAGTLVWIAPEGTRSKTGELLPFKKGGFNMALEAGLRILPITLKGTRDILAAKAARSYPGAHVKATIHSPIDAREYGGKGGRDRLMRDVRAALESGLR